jgi:hypothetical protein
MSTIFSLLSLVSCHSRLGSWQDSPGGTFTGPVISGAKKFKQMLHKKLQSQQRGKRYMLFKNSRVAKTTNLKDEVNTKLSS